MGWNEAMVQWTNVMSPFYIYPFSMYPYVEMEGCIPNLEPWGLGWSDHRPAGG